jgi:phenylalanyl-tRNA synthetase beta chain
MLVSWNWLNDYVALDMTPAELSHRLMMAGLNHESTTEVAGDFCIDLEITSNRPDCLGHIGIAREVAVLWKRGLCIPAAAPPSGAAAPSSGAATIDSLAAVTIESPTLCPRYIARVIRGCRIANSPEWLAKRLRTVGVAVINNVVDITNYVLLECGQPLHAFDLSRLRQRRIVVREARANEPFQAIDHKTYTLQAGMCVIADAERPVAVGGVMGGAESEVTPATTELLIEAADFLPRSIRATARALNLHSPSSYRFERGVDPEAIDWASRRCCELILELAGGELAAGAIDVGPAATSRAVAGGSPAAGSVGVPAAGVVGSSVGNAAGSSVGNAAGRAPVTLRWSQLSRILGIDIPAAEAARILTALGNREAARDDRGITVIPPSWRRDLTREIDLVEEVARIHGYEAIPEDVQVPMAPSQRTDDDRVLRRVRELLAAAGFDEAMTVSVVREELSSAFSPWTQAEPLVSGTPILRGADRLRRSLVPSLLEARRINESLANPIAELFETAAIYLPRSGALPEEKWALGLVSGRDFQAVKGVVEALLHALCPSATFTVAGTDQPLFHPDRACQLLLNGQSLGYLGELSPPGLRQFELRAATVAAEIDLRVVARAAELVRKFSPLSPFPAITRDLNLVVDETVRWNALSTAAQAAGGPWLEAIEYRETYRDPAKDGPRKKRLLLSLVLRSPDRTLTSEEADGVRNAVVTACHTQLGAVLLA